MTAGPMVIADDDVSLGEWGHGLDLRLPANRGRETASWRIAVVAAGGGVRCCAAAIWVAGIPLSDQTDVLSTRLHLGSALGGLILLAIATNLPEIAIVASASLSGNLGVAVGNILGGIAIQTVVLVALDAFGVRGSTAPDLPRRLTGVGAGSSAGRGGVGHRDRRHPTPRTLIAGAVTPAARAHPAGVGAAACCCCGARDGPCPGTNRATPRRPAAAPRTPRRDHRAAGHPRAPAPPRPRYFGFAAAVTLIAGVVLERSGDALADHIGLSGVLFGATILAAATSLPELSTGLTSVRNGDYQLAMSDIFGGNAFLPVLFLMATLLSGNAVLPQQQRTDIYLTALAIVLTLIYAAGLLFRPRRRIARLGVDSLAVVILYGVGMVGLFTVSNMR